jgi:hypothetical protein
MTQENKPDRLVILSKGFGARFEKEFFLRIQEAFDGGYRIAETDLRDDVSMRNFRGHQGRAVLYLEGTAPEKWTPVVVKAEAELVKDKAPIVKEEVKEVATGAAENKPLSSLEELNTLSKAKELKEFAVKHKIELPNDVKAAKAIKKFLQDNLEALDAPES